jgi:hypothetical protein
MHVSTEKAQSCQGSQFRLILISFLYQAGGPCGGLTSETRGRSSAAGLAPRPLVAPGFACHAASIAFRYPERDVIPDGRTIVAGGSLRDRQHHWCQPGAEHYCGGKSLLRSDAMLRSQDIDDAIHRTLACLRANFRTTPDGDAGWYHYLDDREPGVTASAVGLFCFDLAGIPFERTSQVADYLLSQQKDAPVGRGWAVRTTNGVPIVEATAWVLRALAGPQVRSVGTAQAVADGVAWLEANQNTDFGWGSYKDHESRVFTTCLSVLALQESGGSSEVIKNAVSWLIEAQSPNQPAWGALPQGKPTMLHTSISLLAMMAVPGSLPAAAIRQSTAWLEERLEPGLHYEKATQSEDYDVPYHYGGSTMNFQNTLPHFAGPVTLTALLRSGAEPLQVRVFDSVNAIVRSQEADNPSLSGTWELPRSPTRPSIWAIWPFLAALTSAQEKIVPWPGSTATLLFSGCAIIQSETSARHLTRRLLIRNALLDWLKQRRFAVGLWAVAGVAVVIIVVLWLMKQLTLGVFLIALVFPVLIVVFQMLWDRSKRFRGKP